jgi:site-specific DNA-methyltransferase (adenine-specific)
MIAPYYEEPGITIYCADCRDVLPHLPKVDLVLTDPPYGMLKAEWDMRIVPVASWLPLARTLGPVALFCGIQGIFDYPRPNWTMAWVRMASTQRNGALRGFSNWEPILTYGLQALSNDVVSMPNDSDVNHPTPKPERLMRALISRLCRGIVLDPFMGSGTTLVAAKQLGRRAIGIEICEAYCKIAVDRLRQEALLLEPDASQPEQMSL